MLPWGQPLAETGQATPLALVRGLLGAGAEHAVARQLFQHVPHVANDDYVILIRKNHSKTMPCLHKIPDIRHNHSLPKN